MGIAVKELLTLEYFKDYGQKEKSWSFPQDMY